MSVMNMAICIIYDTRRRGRATEKIANWLAEGMRELSGRSAVVKRPWEVKDLKYELIMMGSPIYCGRPMESIERFLKSRRGELEGRRVALFVVCLFKFLGRRCLRRLSDLLPTPPSSEKVFKGWLRRENLSTREECLRWCKELVGTI